MIKKMFFFYALLFLLVSKAEGFELNHAAQLYHKEQFQEAFDAYNHIDQKNASIFFNVEVKRKLAIGIQERKLFIVGVPRSRRYNSDRSTRPRSRCPWSTTRPSAAQCILAPGQNTCDGTEH